MKRTYNDLRITSVSRDYMKRRLHVFHPDHMIKNLEEMHLKTQNTQPPLIFKAWYLVM